MAIKKRPVVDAAKLEAFAAGADEPTPTGAAAAVESTVQRQLPGAPRQREAWPEHVAKTLLVRWSDPSMPQELAEIAALLDRSQHKVALMALERGMQVLRLENSQR